MTLLIALSLFAAFVAWKAAPYYNCIIALRRATAANAATGAAGLVKVTGKAHPAEVPEGFSAPEMVWREQSSYNGLSGRFSGTRSVARICVRDGTGEFLIHAEEALVIPTGVDAKESRRIFGDSSRTTTRFIRTGDQVLAVGTLGDKRMKPGRSGEPRRLRRSHHGVLLLSGRDEAGTLRSLRRRVVPAAIVVASAVLAVGWIYWVRPIF